MQYYRNFWDLEMNWAKTTDHKKFNIDNHNVPDQEGSGVRILISKAVSYLITFPVHTSRRLFTLIHKLTGKISQFRHRIFFFKFFFKSCFTKFSEQLNLNNNNLLSSQSVYRGTLSVLTAEHKVCTLPSSKFLSSTQIFIRYRGSEVQL